MIERHSLVAARLKPSKTTPDTEAVRITDQMLHKPFNVVKDDLICAGVGETDATTLAVSIEGPHAPSLTGTGVNAFEYLMRHGQIPRRRAQITSRSDVTG